MTRALILTASYGSGHNTAAHSLAGAFEREGVSAIVVDHFRDLVHPTFERASRGLYYWIIRHTPVVWGLAYAGQGRTVDNFVAQLRSKLESDPDRPKHLLTVRGSGYRFVP